MSGKDKPTKTIRELVLEYFKRHPNEDIPHGPVVDWVEEQYLRLTGRKPRDPWRAIRNLHEDGVLIKVRKGVYRYDPEAVEHRDVEDFTPEQKEQILKRDGYRCVVCGRGVQEGVELHVDHIKPKYLGGKSTIENGQTLCAQHNLMKKTLRQTETGKKMFIRLYELAKKEGDDLLLRFCQEVLEIYEKYNINGHIQWER